MKSKMKNKYSSNRFGKLAISLVVCMLLTVMSVKSFELYQENQEYAKQEAELKSQIEDETERQEELEDYEAYVKSQDYVEEVAKDKLGLVYKDEIIFKEED